MIATVTLNPSLDQHVAVDGLILDESNRWVSFSREPGGKGINVSRVVRELGGKTVAYGFIGGFDGNVLKTILRQHNVPFDFTPIKGGIRSNFIITDLKSHRQTRISAPGPEISGSELKRLVDRITSIKTKPNFMVFAGSVPPGVPIDIYKRLIEKIKTLGIMTVLDSADEWLKEGIKAKPDIIKPNIREAQVLLGMELKAEEEITHAVRQFVSNGIRIASISRGRDGLIIADKDATLKVVPPEVPVSSTVGAGDSTVAGLVLQLSRGGSLEDAARLAVAAGTAATLTPGTELCHREDVTRLLPQIRVERLLS